MMRYQRVASPDFLGQISNIPSSSDVKQLRVGSGSTNPMETQSHSLLTENPNENNNAAEFFIQWGQKKRSRKFIKIHRRAAIAGEVKIAAAAASVMLPPCTNLRNHHHNRSPSNEFGPDGSSSMNPDLKPPLEAEKVKLEWPRIYVTLSRKVKEDDFLVMKGSKLPQRLKKRGKNIDKALQVQLLESNY